MANNIGVTSEKLPRTIGEKMDFDSTSEVSSITLITGELDLGCIIFDRDGTGAVCSDFKRDEDNNPIYTFETMTKNTEMDILDILSQSY